jgi:hypothetical protein
MRLAMASAQTILKDSPPIGPMRSVGRRHIPRLTVTKPTSSGCTAETVDTMKWTTVQLLVSIWLWLMSD